MSDRLSAPEWERREQWTIDAWNTAFDWDQSHPDEAAAFIESQGIEVECHNLSSTALRCVGFTGLADAGRIEAVDWAGAGAGGLPDSSAILLNNLQQTVYTLEQRVASLERKGCMKIFYQPLQGKTGTLEVQPIDTVYKLKDLIEEREGIPADLQKLVFGGNQLEDSRTLTYYNIQKESTIFVVLLFCKD